MKAKLILLLFALLLPIALFGWLSSRDAALFNVSRSKTPMRTMLISSVPVSVEVADTVAKQTRGLSGRKSLPENTGLLFVFAADGRHGIWMKDMLFPIDIAWADAEGALVHLERAVSPDTYPQVFAPEKDARYVIELPAGFFEIHGIVAGDTLSLPLDF